MTMAAHPSTAGPRWTGTRVARPARDLDRSARFYRDLLGLPVRGGFEGHDGYDGLFLSLPGGGELELTTGPVRPTGGTEEDLVVLYLRTEDEVREVAAVLAASGVRRVPSANPYWDRHGQTFLDPDGYRVVVAVPDDDRTVTLADPEPVLDVRVELYPGAREDLRPLFALAEDSPTALDAYLHAGRVLVAVLGTDVVGHLQLVDTERAGQSEIKNMAVREDLQGLGAGRQLVRAAVDLVTAESHTSLVVATASADVGNLRFYQRLGFRMRSVERDAFTPATGYAPGTLVDGVQLRDRVWLDRALPPRPTGDRRTSRRSDAGTASTQGREDLTWREGHA
jgi:GNAT superfamily N-acetyltransferase